MEYIVYDKAAISSNNESEVAESDTTRRKIEETLLHEKNVVLISLLDHNDGAVSDIMGNACVRMVYLKPLLERLKSSSSKKTKSKTINTKEFESGKETQTNTSTTANKVDSRLPELARFKKIVMNELIIGGEKSVVILYDSSYDRTFNGTATLSHFEFICIIIIVHAIGSHLHFAPNSPSKDKNSSFGLDKGNTPILKCSTKRTGACFFVSFPCDYMCTKPEILVEYMQLSLNWIPNDDTLIFCTRTGHALARDRSFSLKKISSTSNGNLNGDTSAQHSRVKSFPVGSETVSVTEFFSGIGGFRLALPDTVRGIKISKVAAYDVSDVANDVYAHNFVNNDKNGRNQSSDAPVECKLHRVLIEGLRSEDLNGTSDVWTMSPPCQPYTTTRGSKRGDERDNRSKGLYHIMKLLRQMSLRPSFIALENVAGFSNSQVLIHWKAALKECGYDYKEYLLSPIDIGIPNNRKRYYLTAEMKKYEINSSPPIHQIKNVKRERENDKSNLTIASKRSKTDISTSIENKNDTTETHLIADPIILTDLPDKIRKLLDAPSIGTVRPISYYMQNVSDVMDPVLLTEANKMGESSYDCVKDRSDLLLSHKTLSAPWASSRISIVGPRDRTSYCFTKSYGRLNDKSSGSCYLPQKLHEGPALLEKNVGVLEDLDIKNNSALIKMSSDLPEQIIGYSGKLRLFHPRELLSLSGFPVDGSFVFPPNMPIKKQYACIGNSINVTVVRGILLCLFE